MERLFTLDALPKLQDRGKLMIGENLVECLGCDQKSKTGTQATIKNGFAACEIAALRLHLQMRTIRITLGHDHLYLLPHL